MSLIGPRPDPLDDMNIYTEHQKKKLIVRPGITGYNQAYYRNSVEQNEKFEHDVYYAENISFLLDLKIFFKTIATVLSHDSVYNDASNLSEENKVKVQSIPKFYVVSNKDEYIRVSAGSFLLRVKSLTGSLQ